MASSMRKLAPQLVTLSPPPTPKDVYRLLGVSGPTPKDVYKLLGGSRHPPPKVLFPLEGYPPQEQGAHDPYLPASPACSALCAKLTINKGLATLVSLWLALTNLWRFTPPRLPSVGPRIIYKGYFTGISVPTHRRPHTP